MIGLVGCGSSSGGSGGITSGEKAYVDAMMVSLKNDSSTPFTTAQGQCLAEGIVKIVGVSGFEKLGLKPADLEKPNADFSGIETAKAEAIASLVFDGKCVNVGDLMASSITQDTTSTMTADQARCLGNAMAKNTSFRKAFVASLTGDKTADPTKDLDIVKLMADCNIKATG